MTNEVKVGNRLSIKKICSVDDCEKTVLAKGLCSMHHKRWYRTGTPIKTPKIVKKCSIEDCDNIVTARGWCNAHYKRWHRSGNPIVVCTKRVFSRV